MAYGFQVTGFQNNVFQMSAGSTGPSGMRRMMLAELQRKYLESLKEKPVELKKAVEAIEKPAPVLKTRRKPISLVSRDVVPVQEEEEAVERPVLRKAVAPKPVFNIEPLLSMISTEVLDGVQELQRQSEEFRKKKIRRQKQDTEVVLMLMAA